jgi:hypothetical protein
MITTNPRMPVTSPVMATTDSSALPDGTEVDLEVGITVGEVPGAVLF